MACAMSLDPSESVTPKELPHSWRNPVYRPEMCDQIQDWYKDGLSDAEICVRLDISRKTLYSWENDRPEFAKALEQGRSASMAHWQALGHDACKGERKISEKIWMLNMKNRFNWREKVELEDCDHFGLNRTVKELQNLIALHKKFERDY